MAFEIRITTAAEFDIEVAVEWYMDTGSQLSEDFIDEVYTALKKLSEHPQHYKYYDDRIRSLSLKRFPYSIYFHISSKHVIVIAVLHHKQNDKKIIPKRQS